MKANKSFLEAYAVNVNKLTESKNGLTYLSWAHAWKLFKEHFPDATYQILKFGENGKPYYEDDFGIMVYTTITAEGTTHEMWLPVMDGFNKAMKSVPYEYMTRAGKRSVESATMFDINKTIMRCLTKNMAMFGLGLYIYAGEDLPTIPEDNTPKKKSLKTADFGRAVDSIKAGKFTAEELERDFNLTPEQIETITNLKNG